MINKITGFFPDTTPTIYDQEEFTVLRLTSKLSYKVNEIIDHINGVSPGPGPGPDPTPAVNGFYVIEGKNDAGVDTSSLQLALNTYAGSKTILLLGLFRINEVITVPNKTHIIFSAGSTIEFTEDKNGFEALNCDDYITIENGRFNGFLSGNLQACIRFENVKNVCIRYCTFSNFAKGGIRLLNCDKAKVQNCIIDNCGFTDVPNDRLSLIFYGQTEGIIENNIITNCDGYGINFLAFKDTVIKNNYIYKCGMIGIVGSGGIKTRVIVDGNIIRECGTDFTSAAQGGINFHGPFYCNIVNNTVCDCLNYGIFINGTADGEISNRCEFSNITNNIVFDNANNGIYAFNGRRLIINGNNTKGNYNNIAVSGSESEDIQIINNICLNPISSGVNVLYGSNILIENNMFGDLDGNDIYGIYFENTITNMILGHNDYSHMVQFKKGLVYNILDRSKIKFKHIQKFKSKEYDLSGPVQSEPLGISSNGNTLIWRAYIVYTTNTPASGTKVKVGVSGPLIAQIGYWGVIYPEYNKIIGEMTEIPLTKGRTNYNVIPHTMCLGGGFSGKYYVLVEYVDDQPIYD